MYYRTPGPRLGHFPLSSHVGPFSLHAVLPESSSGTHTFLQSPHTMLDVRYCGLSAALVALARMLDRAFCIASFTIRVVFLPLLDSLPYCCQHISLLFDSVE